MLQNCCDVRWAMDRWQVPGYVRGDEQRGQGAEIVTVEGGTLGDDCGGRKRVKRSLLGQSLKSRKEEASAQLKPWTQTPECRKDSVAVAVAVAVDEKLKGFSRN